MVKRYWDDNIQHVCLRKKISFKREKYLANRLFRHFIDSSSRYHKWRLAINAWNWENLRQNLKTNTRDDQFLRFYSHKYMHITLLQCLVNIFNSETNNYHMCIHLQFFTSVLKIIIKKNNQKFFLLIENIFMPWLLNNFDHILIGDMWILCWIVCFSKK